MMVACGTESGKFRLEGRLRNINQGEFWVYSLDGGMVGIDTILVRNGRFSYEMELYDEATLMVVFPNYSEQPVFAESGSTVTIKGDATHMKEMIIEGTSDNEDMTMLRMELNDLTPPDIPDAVSKYIKKNLDSRVSIYLLQRYFIQANDPDYHLARVLAELLLEKNPDNGQLLKLQKQLLLMILTHFLQIILMKMNLKPLQIPLIYRKAQAVQISQSLLKVEKQLILVLLDLKI